MHSIQGRSALLEASSGRWARAESARFPAWAGPFRGVARPPKAPPGRYGRVNGPVRDPERDGGANTYLVYAEVGSDRRTTSRRRRRRAREGRCDLSAPSIVSVLNKNTDHGRGVAKHVLDVAFLAHWPGCPCWWDPGGVSTRFWTSHACHGGGVYMLSPLGSARGVPRASWARFKDRTFAVSYNFVPPALGEPSL